MSSILKALKKLEEEKSLHKDEKEVNISREILKPQAGRKSSVKWLWLLCISASFIIIMLSLALFRTSTTREEARRPLLAPLPQLPATSPPLPSTALPRPPEPGGDKTAVAPPSYPKVLNRDFSPSDTSPARKGSKTVTELPNTPSLTMELPKTEPAIKSSSPITASLPNDATLTLSGIAWNKDSTDRLAIINGQPAVTGATVNGAVVEEILQDRVRMSLSGRPFELFMGSQTKPN